MSTIDLLHVYSRHVKVYMACYMSTVDNTRHVTCLLSTCYMSTLDVLGPTSALSTCYMFTVEMSHVTCLLSTCYMPAVNVLHVYSRRKTCLFSTGVSTVLSSVYAVKTIMCDYPVVYLSTHSTAYTAYIWCMCVYCLRVVWAYILRVCLSILYTWHVVSKV